MPAQSRRATSRPSRAQRRAGAQTARSYNVPAARPVTLPRRTFATEPKPVDYSEEFGFIRKDLIRILLWAAVILAAMVALSFVF